MSFTEIILIGVALAMDAFALTIANCTVYVDKLNKKKEWSMPVAFAVFQILMPIIGYYIGSAFASYLSSFSGYLTAAVFFVLAIKIVIDNVKDAKSTEDREQNKNDFTFGVLIVQAVATSIDALAIGVTFAMELNFSIFIASGIIGAVTFLIVSSALFVGKFLGKKLNDYAKWVGAVILFALAVKSLIQAIL